MPSLSPSSVWLSSMRRLLAPVPGGLAEHPSLLVAILWATALLFAPPAMAQDFIVGQVVSVDREQGQVVLQLTTDADPVLPDGSFAPSSSDAALAPGARRVTVTMTKTSPPRGLPGCLQPGRVVRAWGQFAADREDLFVAEAVRGGGPGQGEDRSGVRSRLHRCRESGSNCQGGRRCPGPESDHARSGPR